MVETPWGYWGMTVCYDLRFPYLFRAYAQKGAKVLFVPSAFTLIAGDAHWEVLLRARAIDEAPRVAAPRKGRAGRGLARERGGVSPAGVGAGAGALSAPLLLPGR